MESLNLRRVLFKNTGLQMLSLGLSIVIGLLTTAILSRYLGVDGFGQYNYIFAFYYFFLALNDLSVNTILIREVSQQRDKAGEIIGSMLSFKLLLALFSMAVSWIFISNMHFQSRLKDGLFLYSLILPITAFQLPTVIFQVLLKLEYPSLMGIVNRILSTLLILAAVRAGYGLRALIGALILSEAVCAVVLLACSRKFVRPVFTIRPPYWRKILRASIPLGIAGLLTAMINRFDFMMLERMRDIHQVGLYAAGYRVINLLESVPLMLMGTLYPVMSKYAAEDPARLKRIYRQSLALLSAAAIPMGLIVTLLAPWIIRIFYGVAFGEAALGLRILIWSTVFLYIAISAGNLLISIGKEKLNLLIIAMSCLANIVLNFLLIPGMGFIGAAASTTVTFFVMLAGSLIATRKYLYG